MDVMFLVLVFFIYCIFDMTVHKARFRENFRIVREKIADLNRVKMNFPVLISGDRKSTLGTGIELLSKLKAAGVEKASFQVTGT